MLDGGTMYRKILIVIILLASTIITPQALARTTVMPFGRPRAVDYENSKGKAYVYYCLVKEQSMGFAVEGPVQVDIRTRAGLSKKDITADYQVQVWEDEYLITAEKFKSKYSGNKMLNSELYPALYRKVEFESPGGVHNYRLWLVSENIDTVFVRIYKSEATTTIPKKISMYPLEYFKRVHLYSKKNQTPYYLISKDDGVKLRINGPAQFIIRARANFTTEMVGRIGYTISMFEDGSEVDTFSATTSKSLTMAYQDYTGVVPSKPTEFIVNVPVGIHTYDFLLKESAAETISVRFSLPKQDIGVEIDIENDEGEDSEDSEDED